VDGYTTKGSRQAEAVLAAAIRCLGRDGYAGTSLQRIADEAGVQKRMVLYYFGSREQLMARALTRIADEFTAAFEQRIEGLATPAEVIDAGFEAVEEQLRDRAMLAAYFGLVAESAAHPVLHDTLEQLRQRARELAHRVLDRLESDGHRLAMERELLIVAAGVVAQGLGIELLQHGSSPELERGLVLARAAAPLVLFE
jgi:TetR/AcrR family transcriptional regulator, transcriptional repressor of bet genes